METQLTLTLKQHHLHSVEREGLSEAVRHRVLLLLEDLGDLKSGEGKIPAPSGFSLSGHLELLGSPKTPHKNRTLPSALKPEFV